MKKNIYILKVHVTKTYNLTIFIWIKSSFHAKKNHLVESLNKPYNNARNILEIIHSHLNLNSTELDLECKFGDDSLYAKFDMPLY